ncbi:hypothetical protein D3C71_1335260 [compost metagenome]
MARGDPLRIDTMLALVGTGPDGSSSLPHNALIMLDFPAEKCPQNVKVSSPILALSASSLKTWARALSPCRSAREYSSTSVLSISPESCMGILNRSGPIRNPPKLINQSRCFLLRYINCFYNNGIISFYHRIGTNQSSYRRFSSGNNDILH